MGKIKPKRENSHKRIGIMTCSNITQDLGCAAPICLKGLRARGGKFARYDDDVELVGIINCAGCPGIFGADKLVRRIRTLAELNVDAIHFSSCLIDFCPFREKYRKMINEKYPDIDVVLGTHDPPEGITPEMFIQAVKDMVCQPKPDLVDLIKAFV